MVCYETKCTIYSCNKQINYLYIMGMGIKTYHQEGNIPNPNSLTDSGTKSNLSIIIEDESLV